MYDRVFLTGSNGLIGRATVQRLVQRGDAVRGVDLQDASSISGIEYQSCDVRDFEQVCEAIAGCDAVVHHAALPSPKFGDGPTTFDINVTGTYNVFEAAAQEGIKRVVQASSMNAVGCTWNLGDFVPDYFPVDEDQSTAVSDPYSLSKHISETVGEYFWRRDGISGVALRMPAVLPTSTTYSAGYRTRSPHRKDRRTIHRTSCNKDDEHSSDPSIPSRNTRAKHRVESDADCPFPIATATSH